MPKPKTESKPPYLSVIVTSRNDDHGHNLMGRMQAFVDCWFHQAARFNLSCELIIVEWNPPADRPSLFQALSWPKERSTCTLRMITVPPEIHARYQHADRLPLYQFTAKNVGLRHARGAFVLATNIDILFSDELMAFLAEGKLDPAKVYRNDRVDVEADVATLKGPVAILEACNRRVIRLNGPSWTIDLRSGRVYNIFTSSFSLKLGERYARLRHLLSVAQRLPRLAGLILDLRRSGHRDSAQRVLGSLARHATPYKSALLARKVRAHVNACGDFTLMSRQNWLSLCGHPEFDGYSMHLDSVLLLGAVASGRVAEEVLPHPMRHFHIDHSIGSGYTPEGEQQLYDNLRRRGLPYLSWEDVERSVRMIAFSQDQGRFNADDWGLAGIDFPEATLRPLDQAPIKP
ncbi:MAG: hypothetical protein HQL43_03910 [Alphaproteobacteria bacterium]|nr:hypothetical protein [Alphaproteobacteria bacterium]